MLHLLHLFEKHYHQTGLQEAAGVHLVADGDHLEAGEDHLEVYGDHLEAGEDHLEVYGDLLLADPYQEEVGPRCLVAWVPLLPDSC